MSTVTHGVQLPVPVSTEWQVVGFHQDPVAGGDADEVELTRERYKKIANTIESAVANLMTVVARGSEGLKGEYVEALREDTAKVLDRLEKVKDRYAAVVKAVATYEPELATAIKETREGLVEAQAAATKLTAAEGLPEAEAGEDGTVPPEEAQKTLHKRQEVTAADSALAEAKRRVQKAHDNLQEAGTRLGDAVTARKFKRDGLTDSTWDRFLKVLKVIAKVLSVIAMILAGLCIIFPGVAALVLAAFTVALVSVAVTGVLYANGEEGLVDLVLAIVGVLTFGIGAVVSFGGKVMAAGGRAFESGIPVGVANAVKWLKSVLPGGGVRRGGSFELDDLRRVEELRPLLWRNEADFYNSSRVVNNLLGRVNPLLRPEVGFWASSKSQFWAAWDMWSGLPGDFSGTIKTWLGTNGGWSGYAARVQVLDQMQQSASSAWSWWGGGTVASGLFSIIWGGLRYNDTVGPHYPKGGGEK
ncbi:hypothetical protein [Cellulomonas xiejunii]|uniref:Chromosome partition protein Smc n=1 Tax=Cellulomonas xiejunii TaxID=2968083 RepID=A0ABY5KNX6_9CELL|nr:hypothetical protein [Cellulomonas xiejunii]MCC2323477.1 hypothetical protein [Cellulomonas xiejunii]UUI71593.1 hypothetical protein NP048_17665 [Cellulomonas xiejunii]